MTLLQLLESIRLAEGAKLEGRLWEIVVLQEGLSKNGTFYSSELLKKTAALFEGAHVFAFGFGQKFDHLTDAAKSALPGGFVKNLVGWIEKPHFDANGAGQGKAAIVASFRTSDSAQWLRDLMKEAFTSGHADSLGFSIDAEGSASAMIHEGKEARRVDSIQKVNSVDVVTYPAAGGKLTRLVASTPHAGEMTMDWKKLIEAIKALRPALAAVTQTTGEADEAYAKRLSEALRESVVAELTKASADKLPAASHNVTVAQSVLESARAGNCGAAIAESARLDKFTEAASASKPVVKLDLKAGDDSIEKTVADMKRQMQESDTRVILTEALAAAQLPDIAKTRLRKMFDGRIATAEQIQEAVKAEKDYLANFTESGKVTGLGGAREMASIKVTEEERTKLAKAMDGMLQGKTIDNVRPFVSLHESYRRVAGMSGARTDIAQAIMASMIIGMPANSKADYDETCETHNKRLRESFNSMPVSLREAISTTTWAELFGDSIRRALIANYKSTSVPNWRAVVSNIVPLQDFRTNRRVRQGGYDDLATVSEGATYQEQATPPGDQEVTYAAVKRGRLESVTMEAIANDDLGAVRDIPRRLGVSAARTLAKFVLKTNLADNPVMDYDSVALIHASHANAQTAALTAATLQIAVEQMLKQTEFSSAERLGLIPKVLVVPAELYRAAWELVTSAVKIISADTATTPNYFKQYEIEVVQNLWQTDANDWFLIADPKMNPTIEIGFLNGREEPELFVADAENVGSALTADKVQYKIRHIYGGDVLDHRTFQGSIVA